MKISINNPGFFGVVLFMSALCFLIGGCSDDESNMTTPAPADDPWEISLNRLDWSWASAPFQGEAYVARTGDVRTFDPEDRVDAVRWFLPKDRTLRRYLDPDLTNAAGDQTQPSMDLYQRADDGVWDPEDWGGITTGISRTGLDVSTAGYLEIWVNDGEPDIVQRSGKLHLDFGYISEDGFWPLDDEDNLITGTHEREDGIIDGIPDGVFYAPEEDIGLDGNEHGAQRYDTSYEISGDRPFPRINGTARNNREDNEDINGDSRMYMDDGYFTVTIDLKNTGALIDVVYDYEDVQELVDNNIAWRKYRVPVAAADQVNVGTAPNRKAVTHVRIWYESSDPGGPAVKWLQFSEFKFRDDSPAE